MAQSLLARECDYRSGDVVEPGIYVDVESGSVVKIQERDELPETIRIVRVPRRFRRLSPEEAGVCSLLKSCK